MRENKDYFLFDTCKNKYVFFAKTLQIFPVINTTLFDFFCSSDYYNKFSKREYIEIEKSLNNIIDSNKQATFANIGGLISLTFNITENCNLNCKYCFAFKNQEHNLDSFTFKNAQVAIHWLINLFPNAKEFSIIFFGGEPLLKFELIKDIVNYCKSLEKKFYFSITTNGTIINDNIFNFLENEKFNVKVSLDGPELINNQNRFDFKNKGSFKNSFTFIKKLKSLKIHYQVRSTISLDLLELYSIVKFFEDNQIPFGYDFAMKSEYSEIYNYHDKVDFFKITSEYNKIVNYYIVLLNQNKNIFNSNIISALGRLKFQNGKKIACAGGYNNFTVNPDGSIYSCQNLSNNINTKIGDYHKNTFDSLKTESFRAVNVDNLLICNECCFRYLCAGACFADKYINHKTLNKPVYNTCMFRKIHWSSMLILFQKLNEINSEFLNQIKKSKKI